MSGLLSSASNVSSFDFNFWVIIRTHNRNATLICWAFPWGLQELLEPWILYTTLNVLSAIPLGFVIKVFSDLRGRKILPNASPWLETCHTQKPVGLLLLIPTPTDSLAIFFPLQLDLLINHRKAERSPPFSQPHLKKKKKCMPGK